MVTLGNGVQLQDKYMQKDDSSYRLTKVQCRRIFKLHSRVQLAWCECAVCGDKAKDVFWDITRNGRHMSIGCVRFGPTDITAVRRWLRSK